MGLFRAIGNALFGKPKRIDTSKIAEHMAPAQALVDKQIEYSDMFMDPNSLINRQYQQMMRRLALDQSQQSQSGLMKLAAMRGVSPGQAGMQAQGAGNQIQGQGYQQFLQGLMGRQQYGGSLLGSATGTQVGLSENMANAYMGNINAHNQARSNMMGGIMGLAGSLGSAAIMMSDKEFKENIELVGKSDSGTNIYEFNYKGKEGRYRGVIAQEVPEASLMGDNGYLMVDYDKTDVNFERIS
jgi:hypothetical protein